MKDVVICFPTVTDPLAEDAENYLEDFTGPIGIRVEAAKAGSLPIFDKGLTGNFTATWHVTRCQHSASAATVLESDSEKLILEANSFDGATTPVSTTRSDLDD